MSDETNSDDLNVDLEDSVSPDSLEEIIGDADDVDEEEEIEDDENVDDDEDPDALEYDSFDDNTDF